MKILFFDSNSLWVCARRMEQGRLHLNYAEVEHMAGAKPVAERFCASSLSL
jgi:hypothetical protein